VTEFAVTDSPALIETVPLMTSALSAGVGTMEPDQNAGDVIQSPVPLDHVRVVIELQSHHQK
jgi:hypothetical protein